MNVMSRRPFVLPVFVPCCHRLVVSAGVDDGVVSEPAEPTPQHRRPDPPARPRPRPPIADVFGDVLPDVTSDERTPEPGDSAADAWYQDNRPPHHDRG